MAGMLPGVECARRRRFHRSGWSSDSPSLAATCSTRRSAFCLYSSTHESHLSSQQRSVLVEAYEDEKLGGIVREAKERLDEKLRSQRKSEPKRQNSKESLTQGALRTEQEFGPKKSGQKRLCWAKLSWNLEGMTKCLKINFVNQI